MKTNNRIKLTAPVLKTFDDLEAAPGDIRELTLNRNTLITDRESEHKRVDDAYGPAITKFNGDLEVKTELVRAWAEANPEAFGGKKSIETTHGTLGWRIGQWQCATLAGWIWAATKKTKKGAKVVLEKIKSFTATKDFVRTKEEVDKDALIAARGTLTAEQLSAIGVKLFQEEAFFIEPKIEEPENRQTGRSPASLL